MNASVFGQQVIASMAHKNFGDSENQISFRVDAALKREFDSVLGARGDKASEVLRLAVKAYLSGEAGPLKPTPLEGEARRIHEWLLTADQSTDPNVISMAKAVRLLIKHPVRGTGK